ncbi:MAG: MFS transporter [Candidatus Gastranaerophilaceae bacterium]|jgi:nitrate/nitrite transporter NarK
MNSELNKKSYLKWYIWGILCLCYTAVLFQRYVMGVVQNDIISDFHLTNEAFANIGAAYFYAYVFMQIPTGILVDTIGTKLTSSGGMLLAGLGSIIFSLANSFGAAFSGRLIAGIGLSVIFICVIKTITIWFDQKFIATLLGLTILIGSSGGMFSQTPLIIALKYITWREFFSIFGIVCLILSVCLFIILGQKNDRQEPAKNENNSSILNQLFLVIKNKHTWPPFIMFMGVFGAVFAITGIWGPKIFCSYPGITKVLGVNIAMSGLAGNAIGMLLSGMISDKLGKRKLPLLISCFVHFVLWIVLIFYGKSLGYINLCILVFLIGAFSSIAGVACVVGKEVNNPVFSGMSTSIVNAGGFVGAIIIPIAMGAYFDKNVNADPNNALYICFVGAVVALIASAFIKETNCQNILNTKDELLIEKKEKVEIEVEAAV